MKTKSVKTHFNVLIFSLIFSLNTFSQNHGNLDKWIEKNMTELKSNRKTIDLFIVSNNEMPKSEEHSVFELLTINENLLKQILEEDFKSINISIPYGKSTLDLELFRSDIISYDAQVVASDGRKKLIEKQNHFWGRVKNEESLVAFSFFKDEVVGLISTSEGNFELARVKDKSSKSLYALYKSKNTYDLDCVTDDIQSELKMPKDMVSLKKSSNSFNKCIDIYMEVNEDVYNNPYVGQSSLSYTTNYITALFNLTAMIFANEEITIKMSELFIWTSTSTYNGPGMYQYLSQFQTQSSSFNGDFAMLIVDSSNYGNGVAASTNAHCNSNSNLKMGVCRATRYYPNPITLQLPDFSKGVGFLTHEFGHLFGSPHTHSCVWNGNNTRLDSCYGSTCLNETSSPSLDYSIMSYCGSSQDPNISFLKGFGVQPGNLIRYRIQNSSCYTDCNESCLSDLHIYKAIESEDSNGDGIYDSNDNGYASLSGQAIYNATFQASNITANNTIRNNASAIYVGENSVYLDEGFNVDDTSVFVAHIDLCSGTSLESSKNELNIFKEIYDYKLMDKVKVFPNPTNNIVTIESSMEIIYFELSNKFGRILLKQNINSKKQIDINLRDLTTDLYFLSVTLENGKVLVEKVVKN